MMNRDIVYYLASLAAVTVVLTLHEFSHALVAYWCGDPTAKWAKRLTLNPLRHFDILGLICFALVGFGWAKPVPINPGNFKHYRSGLALTASAGVLMNYLSAILFYPFFLLTAWYMPYVVFLKEFLLDLTWLLYASSLWFCVFNLLPLYPLDGFRLVDAFNHSHGPIYRFLQRYGYWVLLGLIAESFICEVFVDYLGVSIMQWFDILWYLQWFAQNILGYPITWAWGAIFSIGG